MLGLEDINSSIAGTTYSVGWLLEKLELSDKKFKNRLAEAEVVQVSSRRIGEGFTAAVYKVEIQFSDQKKPHVVAFKVLDLECFRSRSKVLGESGIEDCCWSMRVMHNVECRFYKKIAKLNLLPVPKTFGVETVTDKRQGAIIMEFLEKERNIIQENHVSFTEQQITEVMGFIAKLVSASFMMEDSTLNSFSFPRVQYKFLRNVEASQMLLFAAQQPEYLEKPLKQMLHLVQKLTFLDFSYYHLNSALGIRPVLSHGDLWAPNILWEKAENERHVHKISKVLDWQILHRGNIARDLAQVLVVGTDAHLRRKVEETGLRKFHQILEEELGKNGFEMPYTLEQIKTCYRYELIRQTLALCRYAIPLVETKSEDPEVISEISKRINLRVRHAVEDAIQLLKQTFPEWLNPDYDPLYNSEDLKVAL